MAGLDHVAIYCTGDVFEEEMKFLNTALAPLGIKEQMRPMPLLAGLGDGPHSAFFWVSGFTKDGPITGPVTRSHVAFKAKDRAQVEEFHKAAIAGGGKDYGAPGIRSEYHPGYYGAFIISPGGHNIEAVFHDRSLLQGK